MRKIADLFSLSSVLPLYGLTLGVLATKAVPRGFGFTESRG